MGQADLSFSQLDFPAGKMVTYSKFKECHLALSSLKRNIAAFLSKLKIDDFSRHYFLKQWSVVSSHDQYIVQCC